jgi:tryptophanyl-tRNA synthetase
MESTTDSTVPASQVEVPEEEKKATQDEDVVTAFGIQASTDKGIDYEKLLVRFGCTAVTEELKAKVERLTGAKPHRFIRRDIFFCHRDFDIMLNRYEA